MSEERQKNQEQLAFRFDWGSEAPVAETEGIEARMVKREAEDPAGNQRLMEETSGIGRGSIAQPFEPPYTDPYVRWCGRGGGAILPPIPITSVCATSLREALFNVYAWQPLAHE